MMGMDFIKGVGAGMVLGACLSMAMMPEKKSRKTLGRAAKALETMMGDMSEILGR